MTAEKVPAGIAVAVKQFTDRGWESDVGLIRPGETVGPAVDRLLRSTNYYCVVIGGGVRLPPRNLALFEVVINAGTMLPPDGWRLEAEMYSPDCQQKTSSPHSL
jgi:hypothetical protein